MLLKTIIACSIIYLANADRCERLCGQLGDSQSKLIHCITVHSVPVTMCINCFGLYNNVSKHYDSLVAECSSDYFNKDRINLVASTESLLTGLWSKAYCDDCYNNNNKEVFFQKNDTLKECLANSNGDPCEKCREQYMDLNNFYINLDQHNNGEVCYDLQDQMNRTRKYWSKELKCCRREKNMTLFLIALGITSCLPLLFYGTTYFITKRQENRYNRVLFDEDPMFNSEGPSTSRRSNINDLNNPNQSMADTRPSSSNADRRNAPAATTLKAAQKNGFYINDTESSDDEMKINTAIKSKEI